jgi:hypothetical protein
LLSLHFLYGARVFFCCVYRRLRRVIAAHLQR